MVRSLVVFMWADRMGGSGIRLRPFFHGLFLAVLMVLRGAAAFGEAPRITGVPLMNASESQILSITNYLTGETVNWSIVDDNGQKGSLSAATGERVTYTAPATNSNCENSPTIEVVRNGYASQFKIDINSFSGNYVAYRVVGQWEDSSCDGSANQCGTQTCAGHCLRYKNYACDGRFLSDDYCQVLHACRPPQEVICCDNCCKIDISPTWYSIDLCKQDCEENIGGGPGKTVDQRWDWMIQQGCCIGARFADPEALSPENVDHGMDPAVKPPVCEIGKVGHPISIYSGNNFESQEDLRFASPHRSGFAFRRYYNSRSEASGILGHGWSCDCGAALDPAFAFEGETYLYILDETGRGTYFQDSDGDGTYQGAFNELSTVTLDGGVYVWDRIDGSRQAFDTTGRFIWADDPVGNRISLSYAADRPAVLTDAATGRTLTFNFDVQDRLASITGPVTAAVADGIWVQYGYDANGNLTSVTYADASGYTFEYTDPNDVHNLTARRDKAGHLLASWTYDDIDRVVGNVTRDGRGVGIVYVSDNEVQVTDAYGVARTYAIWGLDGRKKVTDISGPAGCASCVNDIVRIEYDGQGRFIEVEYANGRIDQFDDYDARGNARLVRQAVDTAGLRTVLYTFHPATGARLTRSEPSLLGPGSRLTVWDYDDDGNTVANEAPTRLLRRKVEQGWTRNAAGAIAAYEYVTRYTYNAKGQVLSVDGAHPGSDDTVFFAYDPASADLSSVTLPLVGATVYSDVDAAGQAGRVTDPNANAVVYTFDSRGRVTGATHQADGSTTAFVYDFSGALDLLTLANGATLDFVYDAVYGRLSQTIDAAGNRIEYAYDAQGNRTQQAFFDASGTRRFLARYDYQGPSHPGKLWREISPDDTYTQYAYNASGEVASVTDATGRTTGYGYDLFDRLTLIDAPLAAQTVIGRDAHGNPVSVTDAEGRVTTRGYDDLDRLIEEVSPDSGTTRRVYDTAGNLGGRTEANGDTVAYSYDALGRITGIAYNADAAQDVGFTYDLGANGKGRLSSRTDAAGETLFAWDARGRLAAETRIVDGVSYTTGYGYDPAGLISAMTYPDGRQVIWERDAAGRVVRVLTEKDGRIRTVAENIACLPFGPVKGWTFGNGIDVTRTMDESYRPVRFTAGAAIDYAYSSDATGRITAVADLYDPTGDRVFGYDDLDRLTHAQGAWGVLDYTYDKTGNRLTRTADGQAGTYAYQPGTSRLQSVDEIFPAQHQYGYDAAGRVVSADSLILAYNAAGRLSSVVQTFPIGQTPFGLYTYNALGERVKKTAGAATTVYHYDRDGRLIAESDPSGRFSRTYVYLGDERLAAYEPVGLSQTIVALRVLSGEETAGAKDLDGDGRLGAADALAGLQMVAGVRPLPGDLAYYFVNDHLGTPVKVVNQAGIVVWGGTTLPFGAVEGESRVFDNRFRFAGQYYDAETGLHYNYHRYYDPVTGRYLTLDPIGLDGGINLYAYVSGNPVNAIDPLGLMSDGEMILHGIGWVLAVAEPTPFGESAMMAVTAARAGVAAANIALQVEKLNEELEKKYAGYQEGKPCPPEGFEPYGPPESDPEIKSETFPEFVRWKHGSFKKNQWRYIMQKFRNPKTGKLFKQHYWRSKSGLTYHHLRSSF